jgi:hypothetical protein
MDVNQTPRKLRLVSGWSAQVEEQLNQLLDDYTAVTWNFTGLGGGVWITVVLVHSSVIRQQMIAQAAAPNSGRR